MMAQPPTGAQGDPFATALSAARWFTERGAVVFPCDHPDSSNTCTGLHRPGQACTDPQDRGKHPQVKWGDLAEPVADGQLVAWFADEAFPRNPAIACGPSGLLVVDEDRPGAFAAYAASIGAEVPETFRVTTGRGTHFYFLAPEVPLGNSTGRLPAGVDVRGGHGHGGYVIAPGATHWTGQRYRSGGSPPVDTPEWLIEALTSRAGPPGTAEGVSSREGLARRAAGDTAGPAGTLAGAAAGLSPSEVARFTDAPRYGTEAQLRDEFARRCDEVTTGGDAFRRGLFACALAGYRLVDLGLLDESPMLGEVERVVRRVWRAEPDDNDVQHVEDARKAAAVSPWEIIGPGAREMFRSRTAPTVTSENGATVTPIHGNHPVPGVTVGDDLGEAVDSAASTAETEEERAARWEDAERAKELARQRRQRWAREVLDAEIRPALSRKTARALMSGPRPVYLVADMLYRNGLAVIFGAPGAGKSYVILDIALSLVTGKPWRGTVLLGRDGGRGRVHYVMAEGQGTNGARMAAWAFHRECVEADIDAIDAGFTVYDEGIPLTEVGIAPYLVHVREDRPDIIVFDTKNLMFVGKESQGEDYGAMINVLHAVRRAAGGCAVILVDHSGLGDAHRVRGSNAQIGGIDTEIMVAYEDETGLRIASMTRDKNARGDMAEWVFRLQPVEDAPRGPNEPVPAVLVPADRTGAKPIRANIEWWLDELPTDVGTLIKAAKGEDGDPARGKDAAADIVRMLRAVGTEGGHTAGEIIRLVGEGPREHSRSKVYAGLSILDREGITGAGSTPARVALLDEYR
ncbi:MAG TPA: bifunctional DNA primase/polymerase [Nakamurella sp.]